MYRLSTIFVCIEDVMRFSIFYGFFLVSRENFLQQKIPVNRGLQSEDMLGEGVYSQVVSDCPTRNETDDWILWWVH